MNRIAPYLIYIQQLLRCIALAFLALYISIFLSGFDRSYQHTGYIIVAIASLLWGYMTAKSKWQIVLLIVIDIALDELRTHAFEYYLLVPYPLIYLGRILHTGQRSKSSPKTRANPCFAHTFLVSLSYFPGDQYM